MHLLPRDARRNKRGLCSRPVSVRLQSNTFAYCIQTAEDIVKLITRPGSAIILVFWWSRAPIRNCKGIPSTGASMYRVGTILQFLTEIAVYLGNATRWSHGCYETITGNHRWRINLCRFQMRRNRGEGPRSHGVQGVNWPHPQFFRCGVHIWGLTLTFCRVHLCPICSCSYSFIHSFITLRASYSGAVYCNRSCLCVCDGQCPNLTTASASAVFASLRAFFFIQSFIGREGHWRSVSGGRKGGRWPVFRWADLSTLSTTHALVGWCSDAVLQWLESKFWL